MPEIKPLFGKDGENQLSKIVVELQKILGLTHDLEKVTVDYSKSFKDLNSERKKTADANKKAKQSLTQIEKATQRLTFAQSEQGKELASTRLQIQQTNKANKDAARQALATEASWEKLSLELKQAEKEYRDLAVATGISSDVTKKAQKRVQELRDEVDQINEPIKRFGDNVGNYKSAFDAVLPQFGQMIGLLEQFGVKQDEIAKGTGITAALARIKSGISGITKAALSFIATPIGAAIAALVGIGLATKAWFSFNNQIAKTNLTVQNLANTSGKATDTLREQATAVAKTFDRDFNESVKELIELQRDFGLSGEEAFDIYVKGLAKGGAASNEFGDSIREYGQLFADSGFTAQEFIDVLNTGIDLGVYNDKLPDAIKEAGLSLKEQTQSTQDALVNAFGESFTQELLAGVSDGSKTVKEALQDIAAESERVQLSQQQLAQLTADVFRGAGEDAGGALKVFEAINIALDDQEKEYTDLEKAIVKSTKLTNDLEAAKTRAFKSDKAITFSQAVSNAFIQIKTSALNAFSFVRDGLFDLVEFGGLVATQINTVYTGLPGIVIAVFKDIAKILIEAGNQAVAYGSVVKEALKGNLTGAKDQLNAIKDFNIEFSNTKKAVEDLNQARKEAGDDFTKKLERNKQLLIDQAKLEEAQSTSQKESSGVGGKSDADKSDADKAFDIGEVLADVAKQNAENLAQIENDLVAAYEDGSISATEFLEQLAEKTAAANDILITDSIAAIQKVLQEEDLSAEERADIIEELYDYEQQLREGNVNAVKDAAEKAIEAEQKRADEIAKIEEEEQKRRDESRKDRDKKEQEQADLELERIENIESAKLMIRQAGFDALEDIALGFFERATERREAELQRVNDVAEEQTEKVNELEENGAISAAEAAKRREKIQKDLAAKEAALKRKQAIADRNKALFEIAINTASAVIQALPNIPLSIAVATIGAIEAGVVAARPIPKFRTGTKDSPEGMAIVGDGGAELVELPDGSSFMAHKEMMTYLPQHSVVHTAKETKELMGKGVIKEIKGMRKDMRKNRVRLNNTINISNDSRVDYV